MTPQLQQAIKNIQSLSLEEQHQLLQILSATVSKSDYLEKQNKLFWQETSLDDLISRQKTPIFKDISTLVGDYWGEDSIEEFLSFLREQRKSQ
ncbi:MAG: hypothetical protein QNJ18_08715 [Xenococcaceae cyanobacterium MO_167.B52]|nr:hypothetical protein [Xenococcaceae cyanobacterium MO_167.B52]